MEALKKIIKQIDVILDPHRPGVLERVGLGPKECMDINPKLIIVRVTSFG